MLVSSRCSGALVLKAITIVLGQHLAPVIAPACTHVVGHGGAKKAVRDVFEHLATGSFIMRSDVKSYYASIDHKLLMDMTAEHVNDPTVLHLIWQYLNRTVTFGKNYQEVRRGIPLGCPLSPLIAALFFKPLDDAMKKTGLFYIRFMDDWVVIAPTRWKLRRAVATVNRVLTSLLLEKHPDKTFIGRAEKGFTFLGYFLTPLAISVARSAVDNMKQRIARLYEQGAGMTDIERWLRWVCGGRVLDIVHTSINIPISLPTPYVHT